MSVVMLECSTSPFCSCLVSFPTWPTTMWTAQLEMADDSTRKSWVLHSVLWHLRPFLFCFGFVFSVLKVVQVFSLQHPNNSLYCLSLFCGISWLKCFSCPLRLLLKNIEQDSPRKGLWAPVSSSFNLMHRKGNTVWCKLLLVFACSILLHLCPCFILGFKLSAKALHTIEVKIIQLFSPLFMTYLLSFSNLVQLARLIKDHQTFD